MSLVDLDAARAARREAKQEAPTVRFGGEDFLLPIELPFEVIEALGPLAEAQNAEDGSAAADAVLSVVKGLLGDAYESFRAHQPSTEDLGALIEGVLKEYGFADTGESSGSGD
jgi:hypothetical protein